MLEENQNYVFTTTRPLKRPVLNIIRQTDIRIYFIYVPSSKPTLSSTSFSTSSHLPICVAGYASLIQLYIIKMF